MKAFKIPSILYLLLLFSCSEKKATLTAEPEIKDSYVESPDFQSILDSSKVKGVIVIFDLQNNTYYSNDFEWAKTQRLPASTFKIPNSIIALETSVVNSDSTVFKWEGEKRFLKIWEQDLTLKDAFHFSCVPCYQEVARKIGVQRMNEYLNKWDYGDMRVDSANIDRFWLEGDSKISPLEQIDFLKRFYQSELPLSQQTKKIISDLMIIDKNDTYTVRGKTGWSIQGDVNNGWFVGFLEAKEECYFFATNVAPQPDFEMKKFAEIRKEITFTALWQMGVLE